jgi:RNA polymerase sigma-70 factor (ECF subfamily)
MSDSHATAFERIMTDHGAVLGRLVRCYAAGEADRDDLGQDVCLAIWRALPTFRGDCSERTFVIRIAHNRGLEHVYRRRRRTTEPEREEGFADEAPGPEEEAGDREARSSLFAALRGLPLGYRQVLSLALEGLEHREIGEIVGISAGNVAVRLTRARAMLRERLTGAA